MHVGRCRGDLAGAGCWASCQPNYIDQKAPGSGPITAQRESCFRLLASVWEGPLRAFILLLTGRSAPPLGGLTVGQAGFPGAPSGPAGEDSEQDGADLPAFCET